MAVKPLLLLLLLLLSDIIVLYHQTLRVEMKKNGNERLRLERHYHRRTIAGALYICQTLEVAADWHWL